jgi:hypothetical protein
MRILEIPRGHTSNAGRIAGRSSRPRPRADRRSRSNLISEAIVANYIHDISAPVPGNVAARAPR